MFFKASGPVVIKVNGRTIGEKSKPRSWDWIIGKWLIILFFAILAGMFIRFDLLAATRATAWCGPSPSPSCGSR